MALVLIVVAVMAGCTVVSSTIAQEPASSGLDSATEPHTLDGADDSPPVVTERAEPPPATQAPVLTPDPKPPVLAEPVAFSGRARLDQMIIDTHDSLDGTLSIESFHAAVDWWCDGLGSELGALPEPEQAAA